MLIQLGIFVICAGFVGGLVYILSVTIDDTCHKKRRAGTCKRKSNGYCAECHADYYG